LVPRSFSGAFAGTAEPVIDRSISVCSPRKYSDQHAHAD
jgi:hypothetical protein